MALKIRADGREALPSEAGKTRFVGSWKWPEDGEPFASMARAYRGSLETYSRLAEKAAAIRADTKLSDEGKRDAIRDWAKTNFALAVAGLRLAGRKASEHAATKKAGATLAGTDPADVAGAILRAQIRDWLRGMKAADRAKLLAGDLDAATEAAILEAPAPLSGLASNAYRHIQAEAMERQHPGLAAEVEAVEAANATLARLDEALRAEAALVAGVTTLDLRDAVAQLDPPELEAVGLPGGERQIWVRDPKAPNGRRPASEAEKAYGKLPEVRPPEARRLNWIDHPSAA